MNDLVAILIDIALAVLVIALFHWLWHDVMHFHNSHQVLRELVRTAHNIYTHHFEE